MTRNSNRAVHASSKQPALSTPRARVQELLDLREHGLFYSSVAGFVLLSAVYFVVPDRGQAWAFVRDVTSDAIPVLIGFILSYVVLRKGDLIRAAEDRDRLVLRIKNAVRQALSETRAIQRSGICCTHEGLPWDELNVMASHARGELKMMSTWFAAMNSMNTLFKHAMRNGAKIKILLMDPDSPFARQRSRDLNYKDEEHVPNAIRNSVTEISRASHRYGVPTEVRFYKGLPSLQIYIFGKSAIVGFYWHNCRSTHATQLQLSRLEESYLGQQIVKEFDDIWADSDPAVFQYERSASHESAHVANGSLSI